MDHYIDISDELFLQIQNHETTEIILPEYTFPDGIGEGDVLKLYHPADPEEALRVQVNRVEEYFDADSENQKAPNREEKIYVKLVIELLEWSFRIETELDELLKEEQLWLNGML